MADKRPAADSGAHFFRLGSRVGRRIFLLFFVCALLPLLFSIWLAAGVVQRQLELREEERLHLLVKDLALNVYERLTILADHLVLAGERGPDELPRLFQMAMLEAGETAAGRHESIGLKAVFRASGTDLEPILGEVPEHFAAGGVVEAWAGSERPFVLLPTGGPDEMRRLFLGYVPDLSESDRAAAVALWGEIDPLWLWWGAVRERTLPEPLELVILDGSGRVFDTTLEGDPSRWHLDLEPFEAGRVRIAGEEYLAKSWRLPIHALANSPRLQFVLLEPRAAVAAPYTAFVRSFALSGALALLLIVFFSLIEIRRSLVPLQQLGRAAQRLAGGDLHVTVDVKSKDEFRDVATAFNAMADRLRLQFGALKTRGDIDRAILSSLEPERILEIALEGAGTLVEASAAAIALEGVSRGTATVHRRLAGRGNVETVEMTVEELREVPVATRLSVADARVPAWSAALGDGAARSLLVAPIAGRRPGLLMAASEQSNAYSEENVAVLASLAEQLSVALSNAALLKELEILQASTLVIFARAVDLKSTWTSGHSERVAEWAKELAVEMGLDQHSIELVHRAGLVHDIGKIGVPDAIIDKPMRLAPAETEVMRSHVRLGVELLVRVPGYTAVAAVVAHHHEWWNGGGYPHGVAGEALHPLARLLAISDVFDALTSARPYRPAMPVEQATQLLRTLAGTHLAPEVVEPFLQVVGRVGSRHDDSDGSRGNASATGGALVGARRS